MNRTELQLMRRTMIKTDYRPEIEALLKEGLWIPDIVAKLGLPDDDEGWDRVVSVIEDPLSWIDEHEYLAMIRSDR